MPPLVSTSGSFGDVVRARRSALDFRGGGESISFSQLATVLATAQERLFADFAKTRFVHLYLYVHRVEGLTPAVYRYWPEHAELEKIKEGDQRLVAAALSLGQDLAGNACVAFSSRSAILRVLPAVTAIVDIDTCISRRVQLVNECILLPRRLACEQRASERFLMSE